jgi:hypothetical protein
MFMGGQNGVGRARRDAGRTARMDPTCFASTACYTTYILLTNAIM